MRHGVFALTAQALVLDLGPIVVGAPYRARRKARFERDGAWREVAAERNAGHAEPRRIDERLGFRPIEPFRGPALGFVRDGQIVQPDRFAGAGLIDAQRGDAALGQRIGQPGEVQQFLGAIEPVAIDDQRGRAIHALGASQQCGQFAALIGDDHPLDIVMCHRRAAGEGVECLGIGLLPPGRSMRLHPLGHAEVQRGALQFLARREHPPLGFIVLCEIDQFVAHLRPFAHEGGRSHLLAALHRLTQRLAHIDDLADPPAAFQRDRDAQVPDIVREIFE